MLQQVKSLSDSNTSLQQELDELKVAAQAVVDMVDVAEEDAEAPLALVEKVRRVPQGVMRYIWRPPISTCRMYSGWLNPTGHNRSWIRLARA